MFSGNFQLNPVTVTGKGQAQKKTLKAELCFEITVNYQPISFFLHLKMLASSTQMKRLEISIFKPRFVPNRPQTSIYLFFLLGKTQKFWTNCLFDWTTPPSNPN